MEVNFRRSHRCDQSTQRNPLSSASSSSHGNELFGKERYVHGWSATHSPLSRPLARTSVFSDVVFFESVVRFANAGVLLNTSVFETAKLPSTVASFGRSTSRLHSIPTPQLHATRLRERLGAQRQMFEIWEICVI